MDILGLRNLSVIDEIVRSVKQDDPGFDIMAMKMTSTQFTASYDLHCFNIAISWVPMGLYKSFSYEIFKRRPSVLLAFDGNSSALNLIQEARNSREKCRIYINPRSRGLAVKVKTLEGYVRPLCDAEGILRELGINRE